MKVVLFGATGMVGQGVLRECLLDPEVEQVLVIGRGSTGKTHEKLRELQHPNLADLTGLESELGGCDACFYCLGVSSSGMTEKAYRHITHDFTLAAAQMLAKESPGSVFIYVSGAGTDSSAQGRSMWARVKGQTENELLQLPFLSAYMFRPGYIQPRHGVVSRTRVYRIFYWLLAPLYPLWKRLFPRFVTTTEAVGLAMVRLAKNGNPKRILESSDIEALGQPPSLAAPQPTPASGSGREEEARG